MGAVHEEDRTRSDFQEPPSYPAGTYKTATASTMTVKNKEAQPWLHMEHNPRYNVNSNIKGTAATKLYEHSVVAPDSVLHKRGN